MPVEPTGPASSSPGYGAEASALMARSRPASSTSWWVTSRSDAGGDGPGQDALGRGGGPRRASGAGWVKMTMLVGTRSGSQPGVGPPVGHGLGQAAGPGVVLGQAVDHGPQGHEPGGGDDPGLAHAPPQAQALDARLRP